MMNDAEFTAWYLNKHREEFELPRAETRHRLLDALAGEAPEAPRVPRSGAQLWLRLGLRRLGEQMVAAGEWLARENPGDWTGAP